MKISLQLDFTFPANTPSVSSHLTALELWQGIRRGACNPNDFANYVASCAILPGSREKFRRRLTLAEGAVHTAPGGELVQEVVIADQLHVRVYPCHCPHPPTQGSCRKRQRVFRGFLFRSLVNPSRPFLQVQATTIDTGAKTTWLLSHGAGTDELYLTGMYELKLSGVRPGTEEADKIDKEYRELAKEACKGGLDKIRRWKEEGRLAVWVREDEALGADEVAQAVPV